MNINAIEKDILIQIYQFRSLTTQQVETYLGGTKEDLNGLIQKGCLEKVEYKKLEMYFLTATGVNLVKRWLRLKVHGKHNPNGYLRAGELKVAPRFANHQLGLNEFVLKVMSRLPKLNEQQFSYTDETRLSSELYKYARPDGLMKIGDVELFIEFDTGSEDQAMISKKMERYQSFCNSSTHQGKNRKIIILFVGLRNPTVRRHNMIMTCATEFLSGVLSDQLEFIVGGMDKCANYILREVLPVLTSNPTERYRLKFLQNKNPYLRLFNGQDELTVDYTLPKVKQQGIDYRIVDLTYDRASRYATLSNLVTRVFSTTIPMKHYYIVSYQNEHQLKYCQEHYKSLFRSDHVKFIHESELEERLKAPTYQK